jgi:hypothetical protein
VVCPLRSPSLRLCEWLQGELSGVSPPISFEGVRKEWVGSCQVFSLQLAVGRWWFFVWWVAERLLCGRLQAELSGVSPFDTG